MKRLMLLLGLLLPSMLSAAVYTPTAFRIDGTTSQSPSACQTAGACNGIVLEIDIPTIAAGGTYSLGLGTNNSVSSAKVILNVTHNGYQGTLNGGTCGTTTTYVQTLYATHVLRRPYNAASTNDDQSNAGTTTMRLALGSASGPAFIFSGETVTIQIVSSFYTDGSSNTVGTVAAGTAVTNNSTLAYSTIRALGNWSRPGWQLVTGSTFPLAVGVIGNGYAFNSQPVACTVIKWSDGTNTNTTNVGTATVDITQPDKAKVVEYLANQSTSGLTNHSKLTANFKIYPWVGDSTSVLDSSDGTYSQPTPYDAPQYYYLDTTNNSAAAGYVDGSATFPGSHTSGTFVAGEKVTQSTSNATAYLIDVTGANGAGPIHVGNIASGTVNSTNGSTWTGATSGAVFTQTSGPTYAGADTNACAAALSGGQPGTPCRTLMGALLKMAAYNNASSTPTQNIAAGTLYMEKGYYNWLGSSSSGSNTTSNVWATLTPASGASQSQVVIQGVGVGSGATVGTKSFGSLCTSGSTNCGTPLHLKNITVNVATGPTSVFDQDTYLWLDNCVVGANGTAPIYNVTDSYWTWNTFTNGLVNGVGPFSTTNASIALFRGNDISGLAGNRVYAYTAIGNTNGTSQNCNFVNEITSQGMPASIMTIFAFNTLYKCSVVSGNSFFSANYTNSSIIGLGMVQNIFENINNGDTVAMIGLTADSSSGTPVNNTLSFYNDFVGGRINHQYNDNGSTALLRGTWQEFANIIDEPAIKSDTFGTPNAARVGNWEGLYNSGTRSNFIASTSYNLDAGDFAPEFWGVNTYGGAITAGATQPPTYTATNAANYPAYVTRAAYAGSGAGTGGGNYILKSNSPVINWVPNVSGWGCIQILPYDLNGQIRNCSGWGSAGAYEQSVVLTPAIGWW